MKKLTFFVFMMFFLTSIPAMAQQWKLDQVHTGFLFEIDHIYATIRGQFTDFTGDVVFDPAAPEKSKFNFVVKTESINTNIGKRDIHLQSDDFFAARTFPTMTYTSTKVTKTGENRYTVDGKITIKDVTKEMPLEFIYHGQKENPMKQGEVVTGLDSHFTLDRLAFHVGDGKFYKMGIVGKDVKVLITLEMVRDK